MLQVSRIMTDLRSASLMLEKIYRSLTRLRGAQVEGVKEKVVAAVRNVNDAIEGLKEW